MIGGPARANTFPACMAGTVDRASGVPASVRVHIAPGHAWHSFKHAGSAKKKFALYALCNNGSSIFRPLLPLQEEGTGWLLLPTPSND
jgi:hypothetical protein